MTAISAAIVELKAHCEHTWEVIRSLERFARVVEDAHAQAASAVQGASDAVAVVAPAPRPDRPVKAPAKAVKAAPAKPNGKASPATAPPAAFAVGPAIVGAITAARCALSPKDIIRVTKLPRWRVMRALLDMHDARQLTKIGERRGAKYALPSTPRPGAVAGTQAAPPVGPPSANGTKSASAAGDFDIAWNGTKERNGQAPPILSAAGRERKS